MGSMGQDRGKGMTNRMNDEIEMVGSINEEDVVRLGREFVVRLEYFGGIIYNKNTGKIFFLNRTAADLVFLTQFSVSIKDILKSINGEYEKHEVMNFLNILYQNGVVEKSNFKGNLATALSELKRTRAFVDNLKYLSAPLEAFIHINWNCNVRCIFCFIDAPRRTYRESLSEAELKKIVTELDDMKVPELILTGGEPLLNPSMTLKIAEYARAKGMRVSITTNGISVNESIARTIANYRIHIQIPLHAPDPKLHDYITGIPGSYYKAIKAIRILTTLGVPVTVSTVLNNENKDYIFDMISLLKKLEVRTWNILELKPVGRGKIKMCIPLNERLRILNELEEMTRKIYPELHIIAERPFYFLFSNEGIEDEISMLFTKCGAKVGRYVEISPDGYVYPCDLLMALGEEFIAGDLRKQSFREIWYSSPLLSKLRSLNIRGKCENCQYLDICYGKCRALAYALFKDLHAPDPRCPL